MSEVTYRASSPYYLTKQTSWYLSYYQHRKISADSSDVRYIVEKSFEERPDLMSYHFYGTSDFWWVFTVRNPDLIKDPIYDLVAGMEIFIPTRSRVEKLL